MVTFFDTDVLVCLFDCGSPAEQERARTLLREASESAELMLSAEALQECQLTVTRKLFTPLAVSDAKAALQGFAMFP